MEKMPGTGNAMIEMYKGEEDIEYPCVTTMILST